MALCYLDSFEWCANDATLMATRWSGSSISTTVTTGRTGSNGLQLSQGSGTSMYRLLSSTQENATMIVGAAVNLKSASNSVLFTFRSDLGATLHLTVEISAVTGAIKVYRGNTGGTVLATASAVVSGGDKW